jgi:hypothetical protein
MNGRLMLGVVAMVGLGALACVVPGSAMQQGGGGYHGQPAVGAQASGEASASRRLRFNQKELGPSQWQVVLQLEQMYGRRLPDGDYWYDHRSGAAGMWGGPVGAFLPAGLDLPGPVPANASGGGTGVFINGRELHPADWRALSQLVGQAVVPGRYFVDAMGNAGHEGGPPMINLVQLANQRSGRGGGGGYLHQSPNGDGSNSYVGGDGNGYSYFFDGGSGCSVVPGEGVSC